MEHNTIRVVGIITWQNPRFTLKLI